MKYCLLLWVENQHLDQLVHPCIERSCCTKGIDVLPSPGLCGSEPGVCKLPTVHIGEEEEEDGRGADGSLVF